MTDSNLTLAVLREIRDEIKSTRTELSERIEDLGVRLGARIDATNQRLDVTNERLALVEETLKDLAWQQVILTRYVSNVVDRQEQAIADLRERMARLEARAD